MHGGCLRNAEPRLFFIDTVHESVIYEGRYTKPSQSYFKITFFYVISLHRNLHAVSAIDRVGEKKVSPSYLILKWYVNLIIVL